MRSGDAKQKEAAPCGSRRARRRPVLALAPESVPENAPGADARERTEGGKNDLRWQNEQLRRDNERLKAACAAAEAECDCLRGSPDAAGGERSAALADRIRRILAETPSLPGAARRLLGMLCETQGWEVAMLWAQDGRAQFLRCLASWAVPSPAITAFEGRRRKNVLLWREGLPGRVWATGKPAWLPRSEFAYDPNANLTSTVAFPIRVGSKVLGVLEFFGSDSWKPKKAYLQGIASVSRVIGDAMARHQVQELLSEQRDFAERLIEAAQAIILVLDLEGHIVRGNPYLEQVTGYRLAEVQGKDWATTLFPEEHHMPMRQLLREMLTNNGISSSVQPIRTRGGEERQIKWSKKLLTGRNGCLAGVLAVGTDISDLRQTQDRVAHGQRLAVLGQMEAALAHEGRGALHDIQGCAELLAHEIPDRPEALDLLSGIQDAQYRLQRLFDDVCSYAALPRLESRNSDLAEIWRDAWNRLGHARKDRDTRLDEVMNGVDLHCNVDPIRMAQVFRNIFDNSLAACGDSVRITLGGSDADLNGDAALCICVRDNGPGLSPEQQQRIFEPFYTTKAQGLGLGMAIAQYIVQAHGGRIAVGCGSGCGAELLLTLPR
jgi:two-component system, LuxR family, sensor kinase FixL